MQKTKVTSDVYLRHTTCVFFLFRFKPLQKVDGMSDSLCGGSQHCNSTPEQSVAAQSQHHQQYIGTDRCCLPSGEPLLALTSVTEVTTHRTSPPLGADTSHTLPPYPSPDLGAHPLPERISMTDIKKLQTLYRDHCEVRTSLQCATENPQYTV